MSRLSIALLGLSLLGLSLLSACAGAPPPGSSPRAPAASPVASLPAGFTAENRAALEGLLDRWAARLGEGPVAIFDWDNTLMKGDIGDATFAYLLDHDRVLAPPGGDWGRVLPTFSEAARAALRERCSDLAAPGAPLPTSSHPECAELLARVYSEGELGDGRSAWTTETGPYFHSPYALLPQLLSGLRPEEVRQIGRAAYEAHRAMGPEELRGYGEVRLAGRTEVYAPMRALVAAMNERGFLVWIVSASPQHVVEALAGEVGLPPERVIGIRTPLDAAGRLTYGFERCGPERGPLITYDEGKRCWINREIFGVPEGARLERQPEARRPVFVAGDSDTDLAMLEDARELRLLIDRHKPRVSCAALADRRSWLIQPMFLDPLPPRQEPLPCEEPGGGSGQ